MEDGEGVVGQDFAASIVWDLVHFGGRRVLGM